MIRIASAQLWVHDQDEALAFYTEKVGLVTHADVSFPEMGGFRWLLSGRPIRATCRSSSCRSPARRSSRPRPPSRRGR